MRCIEHCWRFGRFLGLLGGHIRGKENIVVFREEKRKKKNEIESK